MLHEQIAAHRKRKLEDPDAWAAFAEHVLSLPQELRETTFALFAMDTLTGNRAVEPSQETYERLELLATQLSISTETYAKVMDVGKILARKIL